MKEKLVWVFFFFLIFSKSLPLHLFPTPPLILQSRTKGKVKDELLLIDWKGEGEWKVFFEGGGVKWFSGRTESGISRHQQSIRRRL